MQTATAERYLDLYARFAKGEGAGSSIEVSLEELAETLFCTTRNVKLVLRRMEDDGWIRWEPGRGRGNRSRLTFRSERESLLLETARNMAQRGDYKQAFELIHTHGGSSAVKDRFTEWLDLHFGYRTETPDGKREVDTLRLPVHTPIVTLDPSEVYNAFDAHIIRQLYDRLVQFDPATGRVMPTVAHSWEHSPDATVWHFHLRKGVRFHHGRELTADDVIFTIERMRKGKAHSWMLRTLVKAEAVGTRTVRIELAKPNRIFHRFMSSAAVSILPRELVERDEERFWKSPVGTGPFCVTEWNDERFVMAAHTDYYMGRAHLDGVVIAFMPEEHGDSSRKSWEKLMFDQDQQESNPEDDWATVETLTNGCTLLTWNLVKEGPQQSVLFRKAIDLLIDRPAMIRDLGGDRRYPARGFRPDEKTRERKFGSDVELAKALLREAGYDGSPVTIVAKGIHEADANWIRKRCAEYGVNIAVKSSQWTDSWKTDWVREADGILYNIVFAEDEVCEIETYEQAGSFLKEHLDQKLREWAAGKIDQALAARSTNERRKLLGEIEERIREEAHVLFLIHKTTNTTYQPGIKGVTMNPLGWIDFKTVWVQNASLR
ncbi:ABC transporter substrate-binding protein [Cohnella pontilimi]|nr:ABC transporter substrate-binding protein [Cohnella pontilimi]